MRESSPLQRKQWTGEGETGFNQGKTWSRRYRETLQMPARFVCLRLGGGDVERRRRQVRSKRSQGGQYGTDGNQIWGEDRRPKALASEAVSFLVPSCCSARAGCGSRWCPLVPSGIPPCYRVVMSRGREGLAAEPRHGRLWRSLKAIQQNM